MLRLSFRLGNLFRIFEEFACTCSPSLSAKTHYLSSTFLISSRSLLTRNTNAQSNLFLIVPTSFVSNCFSRTLTADCPGTTIVPTHNENQLKFNLSLLTPQGSSRGLCPAFFATMRAQLPIESLWWEDKVLTWLRMPISVFFRSRSSSSYFSVCLLSIRSSAFALKRSRTVSFSPG